MTLSLSQLETFRAVMESGSATDAAIQLGVTQSAVSRRIAQLEHELGLALFIRDRGRLVPTQDCRLLQAQIFALVDRGTRLSALARDLRHGNSAAITLRVAVPASMTLSILPTILRDYLAVNDKVQVELHTGPYNMIERMLLDERAEVGFLRIPVQRPGLRIMPAIKTRTVCVFPRGHPLEAKKTVQMSDLRREELILLARMRAPRRDIDEAFWAAGLSPEARIEAHSVMSACSLVANGLGVTLVNELMARDFEHLPITHRPVVPELAHHFAFAVNADLTASEALQSFIALSTRHLRGLLGEGRPPLQR